MADDKQNKSQNGKGTVKTPIRPDYFPTAEDIIKFIKDTPGKITKRDIARAFGIKGPDKVQLKKLLREMGEDGILTKDNTRAFRPADQLQAVQVVEFSGLNDQGEALVRPVNWESDERPPKIFVGEDKRGKKSRNTPALGKGDRALAKLTLVKEKPAIYRASILKVLKNVPNTTMGVFHGGENGGKVLPVNKKDRDEYWIDRDDVRGAVEGELVLIEPVKSSRNRMGPKRARIKEKIGDVSSAHSISLIAIHAHEIPNEFPSHVLKAADRALEPTLNGRVDLRGIPLITIDPVDARDHDDAIWAESDPSEDNKGGWHVIVAIADVAHYVTPDSPLDKEARKRGNSCYFPDRVVPMLPEALSAGLCSLQPHQDRASMAVHMWFDASGKKLRHRFERILMRSHANINYRQAQDAIDGDTDELTAPLLEPVLKPLWGAFAALTNARQKRAPLDLDMPERKIIIGEDGHIASITLRERFDAHKLVEEFMIMANVCAAEELEKHQTPCMYRVHEEPPLDKLESLRDFLKSMDINLVKGAVMKPQLFNGILRQVKGEATEALVNQVVLRSQTQAYYSPENMGHFGLSLPRYGHFTSPIRRYSDLVVHRGLIRALGFGDDGLSNDDMNDMDETAQHISGTERRAMLAERDSVDRYMALYLSEHVGDEFTGRISGVSRFGMFVTLEPSGGDGLIPISSIGNDYYVLDEERRALVGERSKIEYRLGDMLEVRLKEANKFTGGLRLELIADEDIPSFTRKPRKDQPKRPLNSRSKKARTRSRKK